MLRELLVQRALESPERLSVRGSGKSFSWAQVNRLVSELAGELRRQGIGAESTVCMVLPNDPVWVIALLALQETGSNALLLNGESTPLEIAGITARAGCGFVLTGESSGGGSALGTSGMRLQRLAAEPAAPGAGGLILIPTSGVSGPSKLVMRTAERVRRLGERTCETAGLTSGDRILCLAPLAHGHGFCSGFLAWLCSGGALILEPRFDRRAVLRLVSGGDVTVVSGVPFQFAVLAETVMREPAPRSTVRLAFAGGSPLGRETWRRVRDRIGLELRQAYGSTEAGLVAMNMDPDPEATIESAGRPIAGVEVEIRDADGVAVPSGVEGHVAVRSPAAAMVEDSDRWIRMPDTGLMLPSGHLRITGRTSQFLNIAGHKVNPREVEAILAQHPAVREAAVIRAAGRDGNDFAKALVVRAAPCELEELVEYCRERLAGYKIPRTFEFRDALKRTASGKVIES